MALYCRTAQRPPGVLQQRSKTDFRDVAAYVADNLLKKLNQQ